MTASAETARRLTVVAHNGSRILGGGETGTTFLLRGLQARGHRVHLLCRDAAMAARIAAYGIPTSVQRVGGDAMLPDALRLAARLRSLRPDVVLLTTFKKVPLAGLAARLAGAPRVVQRIVLQGDTPGRGARYRLALRRFVDVVTLNADALRADFLAGDPRLDPAKVLTVYDGVRTPAREKAPVAVRAEVGIPPGARVIGAVARLAVQKRFDRLVDALALLPDDVHLLLAGEGEETEAIRARAAERGVAARVHLPGFRTDIGDVLDALDVFVVSSDREGMANAMLEAMAAGLPVVSTPVSGAEEALFAREDGARPGLVVPFDVPALAAAVGRLLDAPALRRSMGEAGRARVAERFSFEAHLDAWEAVLQGGRPAYADHGAAGLRSGSEVVP